MREVGCVGIVGCSGAVGKEMLACLEKRKFPTKSFRLFANRAAGALVATCKGDVEIEHFSIEKARECDVLLFAVSGDFARANARECTGGPRNTIVIDNSSAFRLQADVPLVVPEINGAAVDSSQLIANPNCTTAIGAMVLAPLHAKYGLKRVMMSTYQAASGAGADGIEELEIGLKAVLRGEKAPEPRIFPKQLAMNVIPHIDVFEQNGYTKEEMKVSNELRKILELPNSVLISCTAVRVPTLRAHSETIIVEFNTPIHTSEEVRDFLSLAPGVRVVDDPSKLEYPTPLEATGIDEVLVGRIRKSSCFPNSGVEMFVSGDQLLRGAALNAVLIAERALS